MESPQTTSTENGQTPLKCEKLGGQASLLLQVNLSLSQFIFFFLVFSFPSFSWLSFLNFSCSNVVVIFFFLLVEKCFHFFSLVLMLQYCEHMYVGAVMRLSLAAGG